LTFGAIFCSVLLPIIDLLQHFEDYVKGIVFAKKTKKNHNKKVSLKLCTKPGENLKI